MVWKWIQDELNAHIDEKGNEFICQKFVFQWQDIINYDDGTNLKHLIIYVLILWYCFIHMFMIIYKFYDIIIYHLILCEFILWWNVLKMYWEVNHF